MPRTANSAAVSGTALSTNQLTGSCRGLRVTCEADSAASLRVVIDHAGNTPIADDDTPVNIAPGVTREFYGLAHKPINGLRWASASAVDDATASFHMTIPE
jgi:hypothetical protein